jgi:hypothetical protein
VASVTAVATVGAVTAVATVGAATAVDAAAAVTTSAAGPTSRSYVLSGTSTESCLALPRPVPTCLSIPTLSGRLHHSALPSPRALAAPGTRGRHHASPQPSFGNAPAVGRRVGAGHLARRRGRG